MRTFKEFLEEKRKLMEAGEEAAVDIGAIKASDLDYFNKAKMGIAQNSGLKMDKPIGPQLKNKGVADKVLQAAQQDPNFKKVKDPKLNSVEGLQAAFSQGDQT